MSYSPRFNHYEHKMIDIQHENQKLQAKKGKNKKNPKKEIKR